MHLSNNAGKGWDSHLPVYEEGVLPLAEFLREIADDGFAGSWRSSWTCGRGCRTEGAARGAGAEPRVLRGEPGPGAEASTRAPARGARLTVRRFTLITLVVLFVLLLIAALSAGHVGRGAPPTPTPSRPAAPSS